MTGKKHFDAPPTAGLPELPEGVPVHMGSHAGAGRRVGVASARFNIALTGELVQTAVETLVAHEVKPEHIPVRWVPGSFELPLALHRLAADHRLDALIACGVVIEGETRHASLIMNSLVPQFHRLSLDLGIPVIDAVVGAPTLELARARCMRGPECRGVYAALAALECA